MLYLFIPMTRVSRKQLKKKTKELIEHNLIIAFTRFKTKEKQRDFLKDFLTDTEKLMLAKRFAIVFMILHNYSFRQISNKLRVSQSTILKYWKELKNGKHEELRRMIKVNNKKESPLDTLEKVLQFGMPPRGRGRWRWLYKM